MVELKGSFGLFLVFGLFARRGLLLTTIAYFCFCLLVYPGNALIALLMGMQVGALLNWAKPKLVGRTWLGATLMVVGVYFGLFSYYEPMYWPLMNLPLPNWPAPLLDWNEPGAKTMLYRSIGAIFVVYGVTASAPAARLLSTRIPVYLGKISFGSYLIHWPIVCSFSYWFMYILKVKYGIEFQLASLLTYAASLVVIFVASDLFERFVDKPAIRFANWFAGYMMAAKPIIIPTPRLLSPVHIGSERTVIATP
jgi:peptidoglycan/LPS O-acetylase OafA/YrhL